MKVLYISDSLGTPIHPRGIFNFSISLVEILKSTGASVDLVVEGASDFSLEDRFGAFIETAPDAVNAVRLSEIHRYFNQARFGFRWGYRTARIRFLAKRSRLLMAAWLRFRESTGYRPNIPVRNDLTQIDFVPFKSEHLTLFDNLIVKRGFYSSSMSRANLGLPPPQIEASGYDLAVIDTPHFIRVEGIAANRIFTVVHDLIPLRDPTMDYNWRHLFMRKLEATLALGANMVFVSRYTQRVFHASFPRHKALGEYIFHPAIRRKLMVDAESVLEGAALPQPSFRVAQIGSEPARTDADSQSENDSRQEEKKDKQKRRAARGIMPVAYDPSLPYFVTATSDEPRKNIEAVVHAFRSDLRGTANVVILGEINPERFDVGFDANVFFPGYVSDEEKAAYFRGARGVVFASLSEGFGIPIVEGAVMSLPVICSDIEVFREVAGDDAYYFDPRDPASLARPCAQRSSILPGQRRARRLCAIRCWRGSRRRRSVRPFALPSQTSACKPCAREQRCRSASVGHTARSGITVEMREPFEVARRS